MRVDPEIVQEVAAEVVLQLVLDRDVQVSPLLVHAVEREVAIAMRQALLCEDALGRFGRLGREFGELGFDAKVRRYALLLRGAPGSGRGMFSVVESMIAVLRRSPNVEQVRSDDDALLRKILSVIARPSRKRRTSTLPPGTAGSPAGGCPAEARVSDSPPPPRTPDEDLDRHERKIEEGR